MTGRVFGDERYVREMVANKDTVAGMAYEMGRRDAAATQDLQAINEALKAVMTQGFHRGVEFANETGPQLRFMTGLLLLLGGVLIGAVLYEIVMQVT